MVGVVGADHKVKLKKIEIGKDLGTQLQIVKGVSPEDQVIVNPSDTLATGQAVRIRSAPNDKELAAAAR